MLLVDPMRIAPATSKEKIGILGTNIREIRGCNSFHLDGVEGLP
jgi:hypothetical protein